MTTQHSRPLGKGTIVSNKTPSRWSVSKWRPLLTPQEAAQREQEERERQAKLRAFLRAIGMPKDEEETG